MMLRVRTQLYGRQFALMRHHMRHQIYSQSDLLVNINMPYKCMLNKLHLTENSLGERKPKKFLNAKELQKKKKHDEETKKKYLGMYLRVGADDPVLRGGIRNIDTQYPAQPESYTDGKLPVMREYYSGLLKKLETELSQNSPANEPTNKDQAHNSNSMKLNDIEQTSGNTLDEFPKVEKVRGNRLTEQDIDNALQNGTGFDLSKLSSNMFSGREQDILTYKKDSYPDSHLDSTPASHLDSTPDSLPDSLPDRHPDRPKETRSIDLSHAHNTGLTRPAQGRHRTLVYPDRPKETRSIDSSKTHVDQVKTDSGFEQAYLNFDAEFDKDMVMDKVKVLHHENIVTGKAPGQQTAPHHNVQHASSLHHSQQVVVQKKITDNNRPLQLKLEDVLQMVTKRMGEPRSQAQTTKTTIPKESGGNLRCDKDVWTSSQPTQILQCDTGNSRKIDLEEVLQCDSWHDVISKLEEHFAIQGPALSADQLSSLCEHMVNVRYGELIDKFSWLHKDFATAYRQLQGSGELDVATGPIWSGYRQGIGSGLLRELACCAHSADLTMDTAVSLLLNLLYLGCDRSSEHIQALLVRGMRSLEEMSLHSLQSFTRSSRVAGWQDNMIDSRVLSQLKNSASLDGESLANMTDFLAPMSVEDGTALLNIVNSTQLLSGSLAATITEKLKYNLDNSCLWNDIEFVKSCAKLCAKMECEKIENSNSNALLEKAMASCHKLAETMDITDMGTLCRDLQQCSVHGNINKQVCDAFMKRTLLLLNESTTCRTSDFSSVIYIMKTCIVDRPPGDEEQSYDVMASVKESIASTDGGHIDEHCLAELMDAVWESGVCDSELDEHLRRLIIHHMPTLIQSADSTAKVCRFLNDSQYQWPSEDLSSQLHACVSTFLSSAPPVSSLQLQYLSTHLIPHLNQRKYIRNQLLPMMPAAITYMKPDALYLCATALNSMPKSAVTAHCHRQIQDILVSLQDAMLAWAPNITDLHTNIHLIVGMEAILANLTNDINEDLRLRLTENTARIGAFLQAHHIPDVCAIVTKYHFFIPEIFHSLISGLLSTPDVPDARLSAALLQACARCNHLPNDETERQQFIEVMMNAAEQCEEREDYGLMLFLYANLCILGQLPAQTIHTVLHKYGHIMYNLDTNDEVDILVRADLVTLHRCAVLSDPDLTVARLPYLDEEPTLTATPPPFTQFRADVIQALGRCIRDGGDHVLCPGHYSRLHHPVDVMFTVNEHGRALPVDWDDSMLEKQHSEPNENTVHRPPVQVMDLWDDGMLIDKVQIGDPDKTLDTEVKELQTVWKKGWGRWYNSDIEKRLAYNPQELDSPYSEGLAEAVTNSPSQPGTRQLLIHDAGEYTDDEREDCEDTNQHDSATEDSAQTLQVLPRVGEHGSRMDYVRKSIHKGGNVQEQLNNGDEIQHNDDVGSLTDPIPVQSQYKDMFLYSGQSQIQQEPQFTSSNVPKNFSPSDSESDRTKIAVLIHDRGSYCYHSQRLTGEANLNKLQLDKLGYSVIEVSHFEWHPSDKDKQDAVLHQKLSDMAILRTRNRKSVQPLPTDSWHKDAQINIVKGHIKPRIKPKKKFIVKGLELVREYDPYEL